MGIIQNYKECRFVRFLYKRSIFMLQNFVNIEILLSLHRIWPMKYSELHRRFVKAGWTFDHAEGSHYFYTKNGVMTEPIPYHGSHEIGNGLAKKLIRKYKV